MITWIYALASVSLISLASLMAVTVFYVSRSSLKRLMFVLVSIAAGAMLGNGLVHLVPESFEHVEAGQISSMAVSLLMVGGYFLCFVLHKVLNLHCHHSGAHFHELPGSDEEDGHDDHGHTAIHPTGHMSLLSHGMDNFTDGILIGIAYLTSIPAGIGMTLAIILHEIPMELGGFGVLVNAGFSKGKAVLINFLSGLVAILGTACVLYFGETIKSLPSILTPFGVGVVIYLVASGLVPQLQKEKNSRRALVQTLLMALGVGIMIACKLYE